MSKIDLQAVLRFVAAHPSTAADELVGWMVDAFGCRERAARDNLTVLVRGGWLERRRDERDRRRICYALTDKGREDMQGSFGQSLLKRARKRYSTCLSGSARARQARMGEPTPLAEALEAQARSLFGSIDTAELTRQFIAGGGPGTSKRLRERSPFRAALRRELLGEVPRGATNREP
jgi:DNA-binding MarR family transcriptional regulator